MKLAYSLLLLIVVPIFCMEPPGQPQTATVLFKDHKAQKPITLYTHDEQFCFIIDREKLREAKTLEHLCTGSNIQDHKATLSDFITTPQTLRLLLYHLYYTDETKRTQSIAQCSSRLIIGLTGLTNFLDIPILLNAYTERICILATELNADQLNHHVTAVERMHIDQQELIKKSARDLKIHLYWVQQMYHQTNSAFFVQPGQRPATTKDYQSVTHIRPLLCKGTTLREPLDCEELNRIPEFIYMRDNLSLAQYLLLFYARAQREQKQLLNVSNYPLLNAAFSAIANQNVKRILTQR